MMNTVIRVAGITLICPLCKGSITYLENSRSDIVCLDCHSVFPQQAKSPINLLPKTKIGGAGGNWQERQTEMELWYKELIPDTHSTIALFEHDYDPFSSYFSKLSGFVLDLGGGVGLTRHYLPQKTDYIVVDPSLEWLNADWTSLSTSFPCLNKKFDFILGTGEFLMFKHHCFDSVLSLWSINHVADPSQVFQEVHRVLKPEGKFFLILEDMEPSWRDLLSKPMRYYFGVKGLWKLLRTKIQVAFTDKEWPVQADHVALTEHDIHQLAKGRFVQTAREWKSTYLTYELKKI